MPEFNPDKLELYPFPQELTANALDFLVNYNRIGVFSKSYLPNYPPLSVELYVSRKWDDGAVQIIQEATQRMISRIDEDSVRACAAATSTKGFPGPDGRSSIDSDFRTTLYSWLMVPCFGCNSRILIVEATPLGAISAGSSTLGQAKLSAHIPNDPRAELYLKIALNYDAVNRSDPFGLGFNRDVWAGVIAHEILHQFQYDHGNSGVFASDYPGFFVYEFGNCVEAGRESPGSYDRSGFDVQFYLNAYPNLKAAFGTDYRAALDHWINTGLPGEGRRGSQ